MSGLVVDASVVMAWLFDDEEDPRADRVLELLVEDGAVVPHLWHLEIRNTLLDASKRSAGSADDLLRLEPLSTSRTS